MALNNELNQAHRTGRSRRPVIRARTVASAYNLVSNTKDDSSKIQVQNQPKTQPEKTIKSNLSTNLINEFPGPNLASRRRSGVVIKDNSHKINVSVKPVASKKPANAVQIKKTPIAAAPQLMLATETDILEEDLLKEISSQMKPKPQKVKKSKRHRSYKKPKEKSTPDKRQTVERHIDELRRRALNCVIALILGGLIGYHFQEQIIAWLVKPLGQQLFYTSPAGGFDFLIKICLFFGFLLAIPVIIFNFIKFVAPAIPKRVSYSTAKILLASIALAIGGVLFAYFISLPAALHFLNNFTNSQIQSLISAQEYFNFVMIYLAGFAALFQMPLIFIFINKVTPLKPQSLMKKQRVVILASFIIAAILTPTPDPINQTLMAAPIIGLYQTSVGVVWQENKRARRRAKKQQKKEAQLAFDY